MIASPTEHFRTSLKLGMSGWDVWTIQLGLNDYSPTYALTPDGAFGPLTEKAVTDAQRSLNIFMDAIAGPITQASICAAVCAIIERGAVPAGMMKGLCFGESGGILPETTALYSNGSRDYGCLQRNMLAPSQRDLLSAYSPREAAWSAALRLKAAYARYAKEQREEEAWKLALLSYNWLAAANAIAAGETESWEYEETDTRIWRHLKDPAPWVERYEVPNVRTGLDWCHFYVASKSAYVHSWSV